MIRHLATTAALLATLCSVAPAQSACQADNDGPNFNDLVSMGGPNLLLGVQFVASSNFTCTGVEVFTGEGGGTNSVSIWSHDGANNLPDSQLGAPGSWSMSNTNDWQGASLGAPAALTGGTTYWMVWGCTNGAQASVDVPMAGLGQFYSGSFNNGGTWSGPFQFADRHWKFRLYGSCGGVGTEVCFGDGSGAACPCGNEDPSGTAGCANGTGSGCSLVGSGSDSIGAGDLVLSASNALPNQPGVFFQGDSLIAGGTAFGDGLRCAGTNVVRLEVAVPDASGDAASSVNVGAAGGVSSGDTRYYQYWYRNPGTSPCGFDFNLSNALCVDWMP